MLVPEMVLILLFPPTQVLVTSCPGAKIVAHSPKLEKLARSSSIVVAPTAITALPLDDEAGLELQASWFSLPAATEKWIPSADARLTASSREVERTGEPKDIEATEPAKFVWFLRFWWFPNILSIPLRMSEVDPEDVPSTLTAWMLAFLAMPKVVEAIVPAQ